MQICPSCKTEVPEGYAFCMECGTKLPQNKYCPKCGMEVPNSARFCFSCGASLEAEKHAMSVKDNVFGGNVAGSFNTTNNTEINNTYITHNESADVVECSVCGRMISKGSGEAYKCPVCGGFFCSEHIDKAHNACVTCSQRIERERTALVLEYYENGMRCYNAGDYAEAVKWYRKAAEQNNARAQKNLGYCYEYGQGVSKDLSKAIEMYKKAAASGVEYAKERLKALNIS